MLESRDQNINRRADIIILIMCCELVVKHNRILLHKTVSSGAAVDAVTSLTSSDPTSHHVGIARPRGRERRQRRRRPQTTLALLPPLQRKGSADSTLSLPLTHGIDAPSSPSWLSWSPKAGRCTCELRTRLVLDKVVRTYVQRNN